MLFFGANEIGLALAKALTTEGVKVMLSDTSWRNVRAARRAGFPAYHGNPTSGHAAENLDLQGVGKLVAVSSQRDANALAGMHFRTVFGSNSVFTLEGASDDEAHERFDTANRNRGNPPVRLRADERPAGTPAARGQGAPPAPARPGGRSAEDAGADDRTTQDGSAGDAGVALAARHLAGSAGRWPPARWPSMPARGPMRRTTCRTMPRTTRRRTRRPPRR